MLSLKCDRDLILCIFSLFSVVKFKLRHSNFQFILRFTVGFFDVGLRLYFKLFPNSQKNWKLGFVNVALVGLLNCLQFMKDGILWFLNVGLGYNFSQFTKSWKIGIFEFHLLWYFVRLWRQSFKLGMRVGEGEPICD